MNLPKTLVFDIETAPLEVYSWSLWDLKTGLNQIIKDWSLLAWAAKWLGAPTSQMMYMDNRKCKDPRDDKATVTGLWKLLDEADIVITQNGQKFDSRKFNARALLHRLGPPRPYRHTDIYREGKKVFAFTSNRLEYTAATFNKTFKKLKHEEYPGFELWKAVLNGDAKAWPKMETYTKHDVLSTEERYLALRAWIATQNVAAYSEDNKLRCVCGSSNIKPDRYIYNALGKYHLYHCLDCGKWPRHPMNLLSKEKRNSILR